MCWQGIIRITYSWWLFSAIWILSGEILYTVTHQSPVSILLHYLRVSWDESVNWKDRSSLYIQGILEFGGRFLYGKSSHLSTAFPVSRYHRPSTGSPPPKGHLYTPSGGETMERMGTSPLFSSQTLFSLFLCQLVFLLERWMTLSTLPPWQWRTTPTFIDLHGQKSASSGQCFHYIISPYCIWSVCNCFCTKQKMEITPPSGHSEYELMPFKSIISPTLPFPKP